MIHKFAKDKNGSFGKVIQYSRLLENIASHDRKFWLLFCISRRISTILHLKECHMFERYLRKTDQFGSSCVAPTPEKTNPCWVIALKIIYRLPRDISDQDALDSTRWEPLSNQYKKKLLILIYKLNRDITPDKIANLFSIANQHYNLRNSNPFVLPRYNLDIGRGPLAWQLTPTSLKHSHSLKNFKNLLKERRHKNFINDLNFLKEKCMVSHKNQCILNIFIVILIP